MKRTKAILLVIFAVVLGVGAGLATHRFGDGAKKHAASPTVAVTAGVTAEPTDATPSVTPSPAAPSSAASVSPTPVGHVSAVKHPTTGTIVSFASEPAGELFVGEPGDASKLEGTSREFQAFVADTVADLHKNANCTRGDRGMGVARYSTAGYAVGGVTACGGYAALWSNVSGTWKEELASQDEWTCTDLERLAVPAAVLPDPHCYDESTRRSIIYRS